jgi:hypothetical protein
VFLFWLSCLKLSVLCDELNDNSTTFLILSVNDVITPTFGYKLFPTPSKTIDIAALIISRSHAPPSTPLPVSGLQRFGRGVQALQLLPRLRFSRLI